MKRIVLLVCGLVLLVANTAEARRQRWSNNTTYSRPAAAATATPGAHVAYKIPVTQSAPTTDTTQAESAPKTENTADVDAVSAATPAATGNTDATPASTEVTTASHTTSVAEAKTVSYSTQTAQGVANLMAASGRVGHWGGNRGPEGCGCGASAAAAYSICCYANSGMATIDVGYARGANGMWYCCRRYR
jgi:hypothetical protein